MRYILFFLLFPLSVFAQTETHNFTTYDTTFNFNGDIWNAIITRPVNLFTAGSPDTASRPLIIMMPGQGQMGSASFSLLTQYGPHYWLANGWDGGVQLGNGKHYPILISVTHVSNVYPQPFQFYPVLTYILQHYHVNPKAVYGTGLSEGAFTIGGTIEYEQIIGDHAGMKLFTGLCIFEGTPTTPWISFPPTVYPATIAQANWADTVYYKTWATQYGGKYFYLEGSGADNMRDGWHYAVAMNDAVRGSAYCSYESLGGGAHCCWNQMYDPSAINWTSVGTLGPNNSGPELGPNLMGDYQPGENVWQWMLRQGDTTLVNGTVLPPTPTPPVVNIAAVPPITLPVDSFTLNASGSTDAVGTITGWSWTEICGPCGATFSNAAGSVSNVYVTFPGQYVFQLSATNGVGQTTTGQITVTVNPAACPVSTPRTVVSWTVIQVNGMSRIQVTFSDNSTQVLP
jgi:hypothetical protein